jgi:hypothetical protein
MNSNLSYGQDLQVYLNANISPYGLSLITKTTHGATHALSISPILVIDDNPFYEGLYNELSNHATQIARMQEKERQMLKNESQA